MNRIVLIAAVLWAVMAVPAPAADVEEFKVKRQEVFEFTKKPKVTRDTTSQPDRFMITFASKGFCDATVAVEDSGGKIVRHLAAGCLGPNAPEPFQKDFLEQTLVWDGKDDRGRYVENVGELAVRVSLGLKARFEQSLFWEPKKRTSPKAPFFCAAPEGVYVYDALGVDHLRLFDHDGNYVRTVYPFPADKLAKIKDLDRFKFPGVDDPQPMRRGSRASTLLSSGLNGRPTAEDHSDEDKTPESHAASAVAVFTGGDAKKPRRIALAMYSLNRLASDGSTGDLPLCGPAIDYCFDKVRKGRTEAIRYFPYDAAFSPDGKFVYLAGYHVNDSIDLTARWTEFLHGVARVQYDGQEKPVVFKGAMTVEGGGTDNEHFNSPTSVACDATGKVYVADYLNDRIQVFGPDGRYLKTIAARKPVQVRVSPKTGEIHVFSWLLATKPTLRNVKVDPVLTVFGPLAEPKVKATCPLPDITPGPFYGGWYYGTDRSPWAEVDFWADPEGSEGSPRVWLGYGLLKGDWGRGEFGQQMDGHGRLFTVFERFGTKLFDLKDGQLKLKRDFVRDVTASVKRHQPPRRRAQHMFVNPNTGKLYILEYLGKEIDGADEIVEIDPTSGRIGLMKLPFIVEDMAFGDDGSAYLVSRHVLWRSEWPSFRQIPFDYGEETVAGGGYQIASGLPLQAFKDWHHWSGKIGVSVRGRIAVSVHGADALQDRKTSDTVARASPWRPKLFPGRMVGEYIHVWDEHGKIVREDALPGLSEWFVAGLGLDRDDNLIVMVNGRDARRGASFYPPKTGTLIKVGLNRARLLSDANAPVPLDKDAIPDRPHELLSRPGWLEGAQWIFGGVGFNPMEQAMHCGCVHSSLALDYFGRTFVPQPAAFAVAVVDGNGSLMMRIGRYGNADDGVPLVGGTGVGARNRLGGDEVGLMTPNYVAVHTDQRLYIADAGNDRILSVKLDYHATERVELK